MNLANCQVSQIVDDARGFSPRRADIEDIANLLLAKRGI